MVENYEKKEGIILLDQYRDGADLTVMNTFYQYPTRDADGNKMNDFIVTVYKDNTTGKKHHEIITKPEYTFYKTKDDIHLGYNHLFIEKDKVEPVTVRYNGIEKKIAELLGQEDLYKENLYNGNKMNNKKFHKCPDIFFSDMDIRNHYRFKFDKRFTNNINKVTKGFFDIEVDTKDMAGDFVEMGECPINCIGYHDEEHDIIISYLLRNYDNPLIQQFEDKVISGEFGQKQVHDFVEENIGGYKWMKRYRLDKTKFEIKFFDDELSLLYAFFQQVHEYQPDFMEGWNSSAFDLEYIIERIVALGAEPADIMCASDWEIRVVKNYVDQRNKNKPAERGDYAFISGNTTWLDQMIQFCSRRKSKIGSMRSVKLDDIGHDIAGVRKLDYHHITNDIKMLPWLDFIIFYLYNVFDLIVQKCIEIKCQDLEYIFAKCVTNNTCYEKGHRQTIYLINRITKVFDRLGFVIGNNVNKWSEKPEKFLGAVVPDPKLTTDDAKIKIDGIPIMVCNNLQDYDYKALYPNIILEFGIAPNTLIGYIHIPVKIYDGENGNMNPKYSRGGEFIENMVCDNVIEFAHRWFHLAGVSEFIEDWKEYNNKFNTNYSQFGYDRPYNYHDGKLYTVPLVNKPEKEKGLIFDSMRRSPVQFFAPYKKEEVA